MPKYNVHLFREMRLYYPDIEADTPEAAAAIATAKPTAEAQGIEDCDGQDLAALIDLDGFGDGPSQTIDFVTCQPIRTQPQ